MGEMLTLLKCGAIDVLPVDKVPYAEAAVAFRRMAQAQHIGKIVLAHATTNLQLSPVNVSAGGSYLITGGLGALGLEAARWLAQRGAGSIVLISRNSHPEAEASLRNLAESGTSIRVAKMDCAAQDEIAALVAALPPAQPLRGIVHCAGVIEDAILDRQSWSSFRKVAAAKIRGAWNLHAATRGMPLDFFILFSSASAAIGSAGQANYAAANAMMDAFADHRRSQGLPALSVNWGPWEGGGMASSADARRRLGAFAPLDASTAFPILESLLARNAAQPIVFPLSSWKRWFAERPRDASDPFFAAVRPPTDVPASSNFADALAHQPVGIRRQLLVEHMHDQLSRILGLSGSQRIDETTPFFERGLDSLMSVEFRNALTRSLGRSMPQTIALDHPTLRGMADHLLSQWFKSVEEAEPALPGSDVASIAHLSDAEAEDLLLLELNDGVR
jgi:NAD(P)-dependent dehydrogenase (short-subunit alcohol dehydrogenase family)